MNTDFLKSKGPSAISRALGVSRTAATRYVKGDVCITVDQAFLLSQYYGVPITTIIDPGYTDKNAALTAENHLLRTKLDTIQSLLKTTCQDITNLIQEDTI